VRPRVERHPCPYARMDCTTCHSALHLKPQQPSQRLPPWLLPLASALRPATSASCQPLPDCLPVLSNHAACFPLPLAPPAPGLGSPAHPTAGIAPASITTWSAGTEGCVLPQRCMTSAEHPPCTYLRRRCTEVELVLQLGNCKAEFAPWARSALHPIVSLRAAMSPARGVQYHQSRRMIA
jgi:hypothetical protein